MRAGDYKLIEFFEDDHIELYNLRTDLEEKHDLVGAEPARAQALRGQLDGWRDEIRGLMPRANPNYLPPPSAEVDPAEV